MKLLIVVITGIICGSILHYSKKRFFSVSGFFLIMWTFCLGFSCIGLFDMNVPSWLVVVLGCCSMLIVTVSSFFNSVHVFIRNKNFLKVGSSITNRYSFYLCHIVAYLFSFPYLMSSLSILKTNGIYDVRMNGFEGNEFASTAILTLFQCVIAPLFIVTIIYVLMDISSGNCKKIALIFMIVDVILYTLLFAGRYMLLYLLIFVFCISYDSDHGHNLFFYMKKNKKWVFGGFSIVLFLIIITSFRTSFSFLKELYCYFCGPFSYLSYLIENDIGTTLYLIGRTQFGFIYNMICLINRVLFHLPYNGSNSIITQLTQYTVSIGGGIVFNSLGTMLHDFIADYGVNFCLFGVIIFAVICHHMENVSYIVNDVFHKGLYYYTIFVVISSVLGYSLRSPSVCFVFIFLLIFGKKRINIFNKHKYMR